MIPSKLNRSEAAVLGDGKLTLRFYEFLNSVANKISTLSTKLDFITVTQPVNLDTIESDTATNNAKVSNATHTGEVTGSTALTVDRTAITNKTSVTPDGADYIIISDSSDSSNLKKVLISSLIAALSSSLEVTADTTLTAISATVFCDATSGNIIITLPAVALNNYYNVIKTDSSVNTVTVSSADGINGSATQVLSTQYDSIETIGSSNEYYIRG